MRLYKDIDSTRLRLTGSLRGVALSLRLSISPPGLPAPRMLPVIVSALGVHVPHVFSRTCATSCVCVSRWRRRRRRASCIEADGNATSPRRDGIKELQSRATGESKNRPGSSSSSLTFSLDYILASLDASRARARAHGKAARVLLPRVGVLDRKKHFAGSSSSVASTRREFYSPLCSLSLPAVCETG